MLQQLQDDGEELQQDQGDAVLERCEQLSLQLREALKSQGLQRSVLFRSCCCCQDALTSRNCRKFGTAVCGQ